MNIDREAPIGVFDSGVGGLTVAREIMRNLPSEKIVYFGDTARVPYGSKSKETIIRYSRQIIRFLQEQQVKAIVIACNTASAFALDAVIVILGTVIVSRDVDSLIYGLIVSYLLSLVMDKVMYGIDEGKLALIVTDPEHSTEICFKIDEVLGRGSTILNGMGSYSKDDKHIIMCACNNKQMYGIRKLIKTIDPKSFLVIMESNDVVGEGFKDE